MFPVGRILGASAVPVDLGRRTDLCDVGYFDEDVIRFKTRDRDFLD